MTDGGQSHDDIFKVSFSWRKLEFPRVRTHFLNTHGVLFVTSYLIPETPPVPTAFAFFIKTFLTDTHTHTNSLTPVLERVRKTSAASGSVHRATVAFLALTGRSGR